MFSFVFLVLSSCLILFCFPFSLSCLVLPCVSGEQSIMCVYEYQVWCHSLCLSRLGSLYCLQLLAPHVTLFVLVFCLIVCFSYFLFYSVSHVSASCSVLLPLSHQLDYVQLCFPGVSSLPLFPVSSYHLHFLLFLIAISFNAVCSACLGSSQFSCCLRIGNKTAFKFSFACESCIFGSYPACFTQHI